jgi:hypothetical protein
MTTERVREIAAVARRLRTQLDRDRRAWEALSPGMRKAYENELAAIWPNHPPIAVRALLNDTQED